jgi:hypothetical protein
VHTLTPLLQQSSSCSFLQPEEKRSRSRLLYSSNQKKNAHAHAYFIPPTRRKMLMLTLTLFLQSEKMSFTANLKIIDVRYQLSMIFSTSLLLEFR